MSFLHQATSSYFIAMNMQQLLSTSSNIASSSSSSAASSSLPPCLERLPPEWPSSLKIIQRKIPDDIDKGESTTITYYDVNLGANLIQIIPDDTSQPVLWDLELNSGHSYYFYPSLNKCQTIDFPVGILRQNWLQDAQPLGEFEDDKGNVSCGWTKIDFIDYYANKDTNEPTSWYFHTMEATFQVLEYEENPTIDPNIFVPPEYCFS